MALRILSPNKEQTATIRSIGKKHGFKGCRKGSFNVFVGTQCNRNPNGAALMDELIANGFWINNEQTCRELVYAGLFDVCMVAVKG